MLDVFFAVLVAAFLVLMLLNTLLCGLIEKESTRYFMLHAFANLFVVLAHVDDVYSVYTTPLSSHADTDVSGTAVTAALHLLHFFFFKLTTEDVVHHVVMIGIMLPLAVGLNAGPLLGHGVFFTSGLPGGLDYAMLVCVHFNLMSSLTEKRLNSHIHTWLRAPGCVAHALLTFLCYRLRFQEFLHISLLPAHLVAPAMLIVVATTFLNGVYFGRKVVENYALKREDHHKALFNDGSMKLKTQMIPLTKRED